MSDALDFLVSVRPEAMKAYFSFLKGAGTHLDVRTRDLISVITKVAVQTEAGFRQYLLRALRNGATGQEVIDALLMAFPVLGLARITWAMGQIRQLGLAEFDPVTLRDGPQWRTVAVLEAIPSGVSHYGVQGRHLFVFRDGPALKVYDSRCPHQVTDIPHLAVEGERLTCPKHCWTFDVRSGECVSGGKHPLREFPARIDHGVLEARW